MKQLFILFRPAAVTALALVSAVVLLDSGCASTPMPVEQMAVAEAAVQRASTASTRESAPLELSLATAKLASARSAVAAGDADRARMLADEATADAQVAEMRAQSVRASKAARESEDAARVLREEISRKTPRCTEPRAAHEHHQHTHPHALPAQRAGSGRRRHFRHTGRLQFHARSQPGAGSGAQPV